MMAIEHDPQDAPFFEQVPLGSSSRCACSPDPGEDFVGVAISAPSRVPFRPGQPVPPYGALTTLPLCLFYRVGIKPRPFPDIEHALQVKVVDTARGETFTGSLGEEALDLAEPPFEPPPRRSGGSAAGYLNVDLAEHVPLPARPATYEVAVALPDEHTSNLVTIEVFELEDQEDPA